MNAIKLNASARKELTKLAPEVAAKVDAYATRYRTRNVRYENHAAGWKMYLGEGETYTIFAPNGKSRTAAMVSESTLGCANDGMNYHVGKDTPGLPEGTWVVEFDLFLGKPYITVHYVGVPQLIAA